MQGSGSFLGELELHVSGSGPALVAVHGIQGTLEAWHGATAPLRGARVILPNLPGRGRSVRYGDPRSPGEPADIADFYHLKQFAWRLRSLLDQLGQPFVLAGYSMGVSVILQMARDFGLDGARSLVLFSGTPCVGTEARWFGTGPVESIREEASQRAVRMGLAQAADADAVAYSWLSVRPADFRPLLGTLRLPVRLVHGDLDDQCPVAHAELMATAIRGARLKVLPGIRHNTLREAPEVAAAELDAAIGESF